MATDDEPDALDDRERARTRRRDRKRRSRMVVDNAGVKRVLQALAFRRRRPSSGPRDGTPAP
jgi:hypothetical protein